MDHFQNFGEAGMYFSGSFAISLICIYFEQFEIVLAIAYITALVYSILAFDNAPRMTFFRISAISTGVLLGIKELLILFWIPVTSILFGVVAIALIIYLAIRHFQIGLSQGERR